MASCASETEQSNNNNKKYGIVCIFATIRYTYVNVISICARDQNKKGDHAETGSLLYPVSLFGHIHVTCKYEYHATLCQLRTVGID